MFDKFWNLYIVQFEVSKQRRLKSIFSARSNPSYCEESIPWFAACIKQTYINTSHVSRSLLCTKGRRERRGARNVVEILMPPINALNVTLIAISRSLFERSNCAQIIIIVCRSHTRACRKHSSSCCRHSLTRNVSRRGICKRAAGGVRVRLRFSRIITNYRRWWNTSWKRMTVISKWVVVVLKLFHCARRPVAQRELAVELANELRLVTWKSIKMMSFFFQYDQKIQSRQVQYECSLKTTDCFVGDMIN